LEQKPATATYLPTQKYKKARLKCSASTSVIISPYSA